MCTVSYIPQKQKGSFVLTSNRDEIAIRATIPPKVYTLGNQKLCFPKDEQAGGSWIAASNKGRLCCLLNGAFVAHQKKPVYAESRGKVLTELAASEFKPFDFFQQKNLTDIEPFTIVSIEISKGEICQFNQFIWDGEHSQFKELNPKEAYIWSSVTLYNLEHRLQRKQWFKQFLKQTNGSISAKQIFDFHSGTHTTDQTVNILMERKGGLKTVSITQVSLVNGKLRMKYVDLHQKLSTNTEL